MTAQQYHDSAASWSGISRLETRAAEEVALAFLTAVKNYGLFPPDHISTVNLLQGLCAGLASFINRYGPLRLGFERKGIRYEDQLIYEESEPGNNPAFMFFRDGILWLEFMEGLESGEVFRFFRIIDKYKTVREDPEDDLVTELWNAGLEHIGYGVSEKLWEAEPVLEFSLLNPEAQTFLEQGGGADLSGFDLLKSVLGLVPEISGPASFVGRPGGTEGDSETGGREEGGLAAGGDQGCEPVDSGGENAPAGGAAMREGAVGSEPAGVLVNTAGNASALLPGSAAAAEEGEMDFWATLRKVSHRGIGGGKAGTPTAAGLGGDEGQGGADAGAGPGGTGSGVAGAKVDGVGVRRGQKRTGRPDRMVRFTRARDPGAVADAASLKSTAFSRPDRGGDWEVEPPAGGYEKSVSVNVASLEPGHSLWNFTEEERLKLREMVEGHETGDNTAEVIELLLILLRMEDDRQILAAIVGFLREEFRIALANRNFTLARSLIGEIDQLRWQPGLVKDWALPMLDRFMADIAELDTLESLAPLWADLSNLDPGLLKEFAALMRLLPPESAEALAAMSGRVDLKSGRRILIDLVVSLAARDLDVIERLLSRPEEDLTLRLLAVLRDTSDRRRVEEMLFKAAGHPKAAVRLAACSILLEWESEDFEKLFRMTGDASAPVRGMVFDYLGRQRNVAVENLLLAHLESELFLARRPEQIQQCYLVLGGCGSDVALPLLKKILFGQPWNFIFGYGQPLHRQGAALALRKIGTRDSLKLLAEAESNGAPHIRRAWAKARES